MEYIPTKIFFHFFLLPRWTQVSLPAIMDSMKEKRIIQGREITPGDIESIQQRLADHPGWNRSRLSRELCESWHWCRPGGQVNEVPPKPRTTGHQFRERVVCLSSFQLIPIQISRVLFLFQAVGSVGNSIELSTESISPCGAGGKYNFAGTWYFKDWWPRSWL